MDELTTSPYASLRHPVPAEALVGLDPLDLRRIHSAWQTQVLAMLRSRNDRTAIRTLHHLAGRLEELFTGTGAGLFWHLCQLTMLAIDSGDLSLHRGHRLGYAMQLEKVLRHMRLAHARQHSVIPDHQAANALLRLIASAHPRHRDILLEQDRINLDRWLFGEADLTWQPLPPFQAMQSLVDAYLARDPAAVDQPGKSPQSV